MSIAATKAQRSMHLTAHGYDRGRRGGVCRGLGHGGDPCGAARLGCSAGRHIIAAADCYGATYSLLSTLFAEQGVTVHFVDITDLEEVALAMDTSRPAALLIETVSNPLLKVVIWARWPIGRIPPARR